MSPGDADLTVFSGYWPFLLHGLWITIAASCISLIIAILIGFFVALARLSRTKIISWFGGAYVEAGRYLPFIVVLFIAFYVPPAFGLRPPAFVTGVIALAMYSGAYFAEIFRSGILSVPDGQMEGALSIGLPRAQALRLVIIPQTTTYILPLATNQAITVVKESSILSTITIGELTLTSQVIQTYTYDPIQMFAIISVLYWILCSLVSQAGRWLERLMSLDLEMEKSPSIRDAKKLSPLPFNHD